MAKVPRNRKGEIANALEWDRWNRRKELGLDGWICPCVSYDGEILEMVQGRPYPMNSVPLQPEHVKALKDTRKAKNWVIHDGRPVLCDYGHNRGGPVSHEG